MSDFLTKIQGGVSLKGLSPREREELCGELRKKIIGAVSVNGGHLASNLGVVELSVALLSVFDLPRDSLVWDVGHQCYAHKLLTGRAENFDSIRTEGGISGFPSRNESDCDFFTTGHSSTSISSALGIAEANRILGDEAYTVAVIGDGSLTGGLAFEGLNNAGRRKKNFIVILNDNNMSISKNVGSVARYLGFIRTKPGYIRAKLSVESVLNRIPSVGTKLSAGVKRLKGRIKKTFYNSTLFEDLGFAYYGPYDGHDMTSMIRVMENAKQIRKPVLIHVRTVKGKGYDYAETNPKDFHGVASFDAVSGKLEPSARSFSSVFGAKLRNIARENERVCAVTAAMSVGTGLYGFSHEFRDRFFDVGIAEAHAVTFAGGLARKGMIPVFAVYSTFLQRAYDSLIHDIALQNLKAVIAVDRAGVVGEDGKTHQGVFDVSMVKAIPGVTVFSPTYFDELEICLDSIIKGDFHLTLLRYPRGREGYRPRLFQSSGDDFMLLGDETCEQCIVTYGRIFSSVASAVEEGKLPVRIIKLLKVLPIPSGAVQEALKYSRVVFAEEAVGGISNDFMAELYKHGFKGSYLTHDIKNGFIQHASMERQLEKLMLDSKGIKSILTQGGEGAGKQEKA